MSQDQKAADKQFKKGQEAITTGIFNWSKDYASAASMFQQALKLYKKSSNYQKCLNTLHKLIQCNSNINKNADPWAVARNYQQILQIKIKHYPQTSPQQLIDIGNKAFTNFRMSQSTDKGVGIVAKIAKYLIEKGHKKQGVQYLQTAYQTIISEQKIFKKQDIFNQLVDIYIQNKAYQGAEKLYIQQIIRKSGKDCDQQGLIVLALILIQRQSKRAEKKMYQLAQIIPSFLTTNQCQAAEDLIKAYNKGQDQKFRKLTLKATITCIYPVSIVRKLRDTVVPKMSQNNIKEQQNGQADSQIKDLLF